jgi:RimJ/RimL family protein N-acetyltransferase
VATRLPSLVAEDDFVVRLWRPEDAEALHEAVVESIEHLRPWSDWIAQEPLTVSQRRVQIAEWQHAREQGEGVPMGIFHSGLVVGGSGYVNARQESVEIGYWVHAHHLRRGYAVRAARLLTSPAFGLPEIDHVEIHHDKANVISARIPKRLGYDFIEAKPHEIVAPGQMGIRCKWLVTRQEWDRLYGSDAR